MKKLIYILVIAFLPVFLMAQDTPLSSLYDKYVGDAGFESSEILPSNMSFEWEASGENASIREMMQHIDRIRISKYDFEKGRNPFPQFGRLLFRILQKVNGNMVMGPKEMLFGLKIM